MSDLTRYRIMTETEDEAHRYPACPHIEDDSLRQIAEAWNGVYRYEQELLRKDWLVLKPLIALLDGLEGNDQ